MHGLIHVVLKDLVVGRFGDAKWAAILRELRVQDDTTILDTQRQYPDDLSVAAVVATAKVLDVSCEDVLRAFGSRVVDVIQEAGFLRMLQSMGDTFAAFLDNVNHLHQNLERQYDEASFPFFQVVWGTDPSGFQLSYGSARGGLLWPVVEGLLPRLAASLFQVDVSMVSVDTQCPRFCRTWKVVTSPLKEPEPQRQATFGHDFSFSSVHAALANLFCCPLEPPASSMTAEEMVDPNVPSHTRLSALMRKKADDVELDLLLTSLQNSDDPGTMLMRAVPARFVASEWTTLPELDAASTFWRTNAGDAWDYAKSSAAPRAQRFVSHSWSPPVDWAEVMGTQCSYSDVKATELFIVAKDMAPEGNQWETSTFWIDKCCIPQGHAVMAQCVVHLEEFIKRCDGMVVLFTWRYFERLWCVYEWASFLVYHDASNIDLCVAAFLRPTTRHHFLSAIKAFTVKDAKCCVEGDRAVLQAKVDEYYFSNAHFERYARETAVAILATFELRRVGRDTCFFEEQFVPWRNLAEELGMCELVAALHKVDYDAWREGADGLMSDAGDVLPDSLGKSKRQWQKYYSAEVDDWFDVHILPVLAKSRVEAVRPQHAHRITLARRRTMNRHA